MSTPITCLADLDHFKASPPVPGYPAGQRRFFSPIDDVHGVILAVLGAARHSVVVMMFGWDDDEIQGALASKLADPNFFVQLTLDSSQAGGVHERALLAKWHHDEPGNSVAVGRSSRGAILHDKMLIIDGLWVISGSTNLSTSGETLQANEAIVVQDPFIAAEVRAVIDVQHTSVLQQMAKKAAG